MLAVGYDDPNAADLEGCFVSNRIVPRQDGERLKPALSCLFALYPQSPSQPARWD
jgi:hypothetical protein